MGNMKRANYPTLVPILLVALYHAVCHGTECGYNDRHVRPTSKKADPAAGVIETLLTSGEDPNRCGILSPARAWRWPGAVSLLRKYGAQETVSGKRSMT